jgi:hypothetical protein
MRRLGLRILADTPHLGPRKPVLLRQRLLRLACAELLTDVIVAAGVPAQLGIVVADDIGDGLGVTAEAVGDLGEVEALGNQVGDMFVEAVVRHGEMIAEGAQEGKQTITGH